MEKTSRVFRGSYGLPYVNSEGQKDLWFVYTDYYHAELYSGKYLRGFYTRKSEEEVNEIAKEWNKNDG